MGCAASVSAVPVPPPSSFEVGTPSVQPGAPCGSIEHPTLAAEEDDAENGLFEKYTLLVVGASGVGKTSVVRRYLCHSFEEDGERPTARVILGVKYLQNGLVNANHDSASAGANLAFDTFGGVGGATSGTAATPATCDPAAAENLVHDVVVEVWDTPGVLLPLLMSAYARRAHGVLVVTDTTDPVSFREISRWKDEVAKHYADRPPECTPPLLLFANKSDSASSIMNEKEIANSASAFSLVDGILGSAQKDMHVDAAFDTLVNAMRAARRARLYDRAQRMRFAEEQAALNAAVVARTSTSSKSSEAAAASVRRASDTPPPPQLPEDLSPPPTLNLPRRTSSPVPASPQLSLPLSPALPPKSPSPATRRLISTTSIDAAAPVSPVARRVTISIAPIEEDASPPPIAATG